MNQIMWFAISIAISITISILLPFPISLVVIIGVFILLNFYMRRRMMRRMGVGGGGMFGSGSSMFSDNSLNYYCMSCGTKDKEAACPKLKLYSFCTNGGRYHEHTIHFDEVGYEHRII